MRRPGLPTGLVRGVPVITAPENLDRSNTRLLLAAVRYWAAYGYASFVIDMSRTVVCDLPTVGRRPRAARCAWSRPRR
jgi:hypothetical protein